MIRVQPTVSIEVVLTCIEAEGQIAYPSDEEVVLARLSDAHREFGFAHGQAYLVGMRQQLDADIGMLAVQGC